MYCTHLKTTKVEETALVFSTINHWQKEKSASTRTVTEFHASLSELPKAHVEAGESLYAYFRL